jgi:hypothetical protein
MLAPRNYRTYLAHPLARAVRAARLAMARGRCEDCGARATEAHHTDYPIWGAFDTPSNLVALCHGCHARRHNKKH